jgi:hypothetical protein
MPDLYFPDKLRDGFAMTELPWVPWVEPGRA